MGYLPPPVIPAKAGIHRKIKDFGFAGMTQSSFIYQSVKSS
jgi:hypothetical protein